MPRPPDELVQVRALTAAFFARFFESDTTAERTDATRSFFWLLAMLAAPGLHQTTNRQFLWEPLARRGEGIAALHQAVRSDTAEYLALTFVAVAIVAAARWQSLVIDGRDALVLGSLPARARIIVIAKLAALAGYTALLAAGMHLGSAVVHGVALGGLERPTNVLGTIAGMAIAGIGLTVFVVTAVASIQSAALALVGPRRFARISVTMQMALVASVLVIFVLMPGKSAGAFSTFDADGIGGPAWAFFLPPVWFLGVYETVAGSATAELQALARSGWLAMALALGVLLVASPIAGARTLRAAFAMSALARWPIGRWLADRLAQALTRQPAARGAIAFTLATLGRVSGPRLVFALLCAAGLTSLVPVLAAVLSLHPEGTTAVLAFPFVMQFFALLGLRLAIRTPVELPGRWLFDQTDVSPLAGRAAAWRILFVGGVIVPVLVTAVLWLRLWDPAVATARLVAALSGGWLALEVLLWGYVGVPCSRPVVSAAFRGRTLALVVGFEVYCFESAAAQAGWQNQILPVLWQAIFFTVAAASVHVGSQRSAAVNAIVDEHLDPRLDLEIVGPLVRKATDAELKLRATYRHDST
jgi:hypothetical protein